MKYILMFLLAFSISSCSTCDKCPPKYQTKFIAPKLLCPVPPEAKFDKITSDDTYIGEVYDFDGRKMILLDSYNDKMKKFSDKLGSNLQSVREESQYWRLVYYVCVQNSLDAINQIIEQSEKK